MGSSINPFHQAAGTTESSPSGGSYCSVSKALQDFQNAQMSDEEIADRIDQMDFENAVISLWTSCNADGRLDHFLFYPKSIDPFGNEILGIRKLDADLSFSEKTDDYGNNLFDLPNAQKTLSLNGRCKIASININVLADDALKMRLKILKTLVQREDLTLRAINEELLI